jgi:dipeptidyl aminopeptidase/acylaminoacyl peptidase
VPELGTDHWMNDHAQHTLDAIIADAGANNPIDLNIVHTMGTSMGGGSALAYAIHRPDLVRSVCSFLGISDFAQWVGENPKYLSSVSAAYGGTPAEVPEAYRKTSAMENLDAFKNIPVFLVHGAADTTVPPSQSRQLAAALGAKGYEVTLREAEGTGHDDAAVTPFQEEIVGFLDTVTARTTPEPSAFVLLATGLLALLALLAFVWRKRQQNWRGHS